MQFIHRNICVVGENFAENVGKMKCGREQAPMIDRDWTSVDLAKREMFHV